MLSIVGHLLTDLFLAMLALGLLWYWGPFFAILFSRPRSNLNVEAVSSRIPQIIVLSPCFNGKDCLPHFMGCMLAQDYPRERFRIIVIADNCTDDSAQRARELGADEVYERWNPYFRGKGYALEEFMQNKLRHESFDYLLLFDIDAEVGTDYLRKAVSHFYSGASVIQGSTVSKNPDESMFTRIGDYIQSILRLHQRGRSLLGLDPILIGSHGIGIDRDALTRLGWHIAPKGPDGDDLELALRCYLNGVSVTYAPDLQVINDLPTQGNAIRHQRRRWTRSVLRLAPEYMFSLIRRGIRGDWKAWDVLVGILLLPSFSNLFLILNATAVGLMAASCRYPAWRLESMLALVLWGSDVLYLWMSLRRAGVRARGKDIFGILCYLAVRAVALIESFIFVGSKEWWPTTHPGTKHANYEHDLPRRSL